MFRALRRALSPRKAVFLVALAVAAGCTLNTDVMGPAVLIKVSGDGQSAAVNTLFPSELAVVVANQFGEPLAGETVNWRIVSGGGSLSATSVQTNDSGAASVTYTSGATTGSVVIEARVSGVPALTFNLTVT
jgi:hypothetical protein